MQLLGLSSTKTEKGEAKGYLTGILYLSPADLSGVNLCPFASAECKAMCLNTAGRGVFKAVQAGRMRKTELFLSHREEFKRQLRDDIKALIRKADREGLLPCVRLNGTSDVAWHRIAADIMREFPMVPFYDYTKNPVSLRADLPENYSLTFSRSESNEAECLEALQAGHNVAVVFSGELPREWHGFPVHNGDETDLRFLDPKGVVVGLKAKGKARKAEAGGFVVQS